MSAATIKIVSCPTCGTKNRIRAGVPGGTFRCGSCQTPLRSSQRYGFFSRLVSGAPEFFCRSARALSALVLFAIPAWITYYSLSHPAPNTAKSGSSHSTEQDDKIPKSWLKAEDDLFDRLAQEQPAPPPFLEPELPLPNTGDFRDYTGRRRLAPFEIKSSTGTHYLIKLDDSRTGATVQTIFVCGGSTVEVDVPLGTYTVKYASGDKWYGYKHLFGPNTSYSKASTLFTFSSEAGKYAGHTITLYTVPNGNLHMGKINAADF